MRLIDHIKRCPIVFDPLTKAVTWDTRQLITSNTVTFVVDNVVSQLVESVTELESPDHQGTEYTEVGKALLQFTGPKPGQQPNESGLYDASPWGGYVGVIPPFDNCFFEFRYPWKSTLGIEVDGVHILSGQALLDHDSKLVLWVATEYPDVKFTILAKVYYRMCPPGREPVLAVDSEAIIACDDQGRIILFKRFATFTDEDKQAMSEADVAYANSIADARTFLITLASMMLMGTGSVKTTLSPEEKKSRQQKRYEERHPDRATDGPTRYYTLDIEPLKPQPDCKDEEAHRGGWEMAWHRVRGHMRHYKTGLVVPVKPHSRGNPLKGIIVKDYNVKL